jgi:hypothetical protein
MWFGASTLLDHGIYSFLTALASTQRPWASLRRTVKQAMPVYSHLGSAVSGCAALTFAR